ncbi:hypothetical protein L873DRAFT_1700094, partial [Choiromyces venosus 120613-1]
PEFYIYKQKSLDHNRKKAHNLEDLLNCFEWYKTLCDKHRIMVSNTYNFDKNGFQIGIRKDLWIVTLDSDQ